MLQVEINLFCLSQVFKLHLKLEVSHKILSTNFDVKLNCLNVIGKDHSPHLEHSPPYNILTNSKSGHQQLSSLSLRSEPSIGKSNKNLGIGIGASSSRLLPVVLDYGSNMQSRSRL